MKHFGSRKRINITPDKNKSAFWVLGKDGGKRVIMGAYSHESDAESDAYQNFQNYEVIQLRTSNRQEAARMIRKRVLDDTHSIEDTFQRFKHMEKENEDY